MGLVAVDAFEFDGDAVDEEFVALDFNRAEADVLRHSFENVAVSILERDEQGVKIRVFRRPEMRRLRFHDAAGMVEEFGGDFAAVSLTGERGFHLELAIGGRVDVDVRNVCGRHGNETDVTEDTGEPPHVLVFHV